jgi:dienelactone hydrolase
MEETIMISKKTNWFLVGISLVLLTSTAVAAQVTDGGYRIFRPDGPGPHPAVVFVSGCSGFTPAFAPKGYELWAERLRGLGFVAVWADYLGRRNLKSCVDPTLTQHDAAEMQSCRVDAPVAALRRRQAHPALGWSYAVAVFFVWQPQR